MNQYLLYILPFKNGQHFKFGITKVQSLDRIKSLNKTDEYLGIDGYTEIRSIDELENTIKIVESYRSFSLKKESLSDYEEKQKIFF